MLHYIFQAHNSDLHIPDHLSAFKCLIVVERDIPAEFRARVSEQLVRAGCLYALAWGRECSSWDDSIDWAHLDTQNGAEFREEDHVVTTWHDEDSLADTVAFARSCAHPIVTLDDLVVLDLGLNDRREQFAALYAAD